jgi:small subunit ribosomal protein S9
MAEALYRGTGRRKTAVARVRLLPGDGTITVNGRDVEEYFPRPAYRAAVRAPLELLGAASRYDVVAKIEGGGSTGQADALRHGIARRSPRSRRRPEAS